MKISTVDLFERFPRARTILVTSGEEFVSDRDALLPAADLLGAKTDTPCVYLAAKTRRPRGPLGSALEYDIGGDPRSHEVAEVVLALLPQGYVHVMKDRFGASGMWRLNGRPMCSRAALLAMHVPGVIRVLDAVRVGVAPETTDAQIEAIEDELRKRLGDTPFYVTRVSGEAPHDQ